MGWTARSSRRVGRSAFVGGPDGDLGVDRVLVLKKLFLSFGEVDPRSSEILHLLRSRGEEMNFTAFVTGTGSRGPGLDKSDAHDLSQGGISGRLFDAFADLAAEPEHVLAHGPDAATKCSKVSSGHAAVPP